MKLEEWIKKHRQRFDEVEAPDYLWSEICKAVPERSSSNRYLRISFAAAAILIIGWGLFVFKANSLSHPDDYLPTEFVAQEASYQRDVQALKQDLDLRQLQNEPDYQWVFDELALLDSINQQYRGEAKYLVPQEELMAVLIDNYEKRLRLLYRLQMELERNQKHIQNENFNL